MLWAVRGVRVTLPGFSEGKSMSAVCCTGSLVECEHTENGSAVCSVSSAAFT